MGYSHLLSNLRLRGSDNGSHNLLISLGGSRGVDRSVGSALLRLVGGDGLSRDIRRRRLVRRRVTSLNLLHSRMRLEVESATRSDGQSSRT